MCGNPVTDAARFCSTCGHQLNQVTPAPKPVATRWHHNIWLVLFLLFFVLGPFGLPLVWTNPRFSRVVKLALTAAMVLYMGLLAVLIGRMVQAVTYEMQQLNEVLRF